MGSSLTGLTRFTGLGDREVLDGINMINGIGGLLSGIAQNAFEIILIVLILSKKFRGLRQALSRNHHV
jgi:hypothetical protein